jgi:diadenosine tetraphosphate (Ap4A) HIT family hydrolase
VLVIPKKPYVDFKDFTDKASEAEIAAYFKAISEVIIKLGINETGYRLIANSGANGGQEVPHFHMHILAGEHVGPMVAK